MKNLLIYINPSKEFNDEHKLLAKIQIDNSIDLGWKKEDIIFVTNFEYEYKGIKSLVVSNENYCSHCSQASKINTIIDLFEQNIIKEGELYWFHDFDAFQMEVITEYELKLDLADFGLTDYGRMSRWSTGSIFFKKSAKDIFCWIKESVYNNKTDEERALVILTDSNTNKINERIKKINLTYNFTALHTGRCYKTVEKPIKVIHFHPFRVSQFGRYFDVLGFFMHGKNNLNEPIITDRLMEIFKYHGIK